MNGKGRIFRAKTGEAGDEPSYIEGIVMRKISHLVTEAEAGRTVRSIALKEMHLSRGAFSSLKFQNAVLCGDVPVHADTRLQAGQILTVVFPEDAGETREAVPGSIPIVWKDEDYIIVDKPAPLPTLSSRRQTGDTLESLLLAQMGCPADHVFRPVNRLDKGTSGLLVIAKNAHAQQLLQRQLHTDDFIREYQAVCMGVPPLPEGRIDLPIGKMGEGSKRCVCPDGKPAATRYRVETEENGVSLLRLRLETGRTHQIRVHTSHLGFPVAGDYLYGAACPALPGRFALHACFVSFLHPVTGERIIASSPIPGELLTLFFREMTHP